MVEKNIKNMVKLTSTEAILVSLLQSKLELMESEYD